MDPYLIQTIEPTPMQRAAVAAVEEHLSRWKTHPLVSAPTGSGKTVIISLLIAELLRARPAARACILAHRRELLTQAEDDLKAVWPDAPCGIWSASLGRRESARVMIAGIQSVFRIAKKLPAFDLIVIDEAHLISGDRDSMYRQFIRDARRVNPEVRIVGFTATPYRLDGGLLYGKGKLFGKVCYAADLRELLLEGKLCPLRTRAAEAEINTVGVRTRQGDFDSSELELRATAPAVVHSAVAEIVKAGRSRKAWLIFCCGVKHARQVAAILRVEHGIDAPVVVGDTSPDERAKAVDDLKEGRVRALINVNVLTTGFNVRRIDLIAVLRPTQSTSLWVQMVGRGFRTHPDKKDCLILDFGGNCLRHGPLDNLKVRTKENRGDGDAPAKMCPACREMVGATAKECPECGFAFPEPEPAPAHDAEPSDAPILLTDEPASVDPATAAVLASKEGKQIVGWATTFKKAEGRWPTTREYRRLVAGQTCGWKRLDQRLRTQGTTLARLLRAASGRPATRPPNRTTISKLEILKQCDAHFARTGQWPTRRTSPEFRSFDGGLRMGCRGLGKGGDTLAGLLSRERGYQPLNLTKPPPLSEAEIIEDARYHLRVTGRLPTKKSGPVLNAPNDKWSSRHAALRDGSRGLAGAPRSLRQLFEKHGLIPPGTPNNASPKAQAPADPEPARLLSAAIDLASHGGHSPLPAREDAA